MNILKLYGWATVFEDYKLMNATGGDIDRNQKSLKR